MGRNGVPTSHNMTFVFGSWRTGVKPLGFRVVVKGGFFWSAVAQTLVSYGIESSSRIRATFHGLGPAGRCQYAISLTKCRLVVDYERKPNV